jgi:hypothetical protein
MVCSVAVCGEAPAGGSRQRAGPPKQDFRAEINGMLYVLKTGCFLEKLGACLNICENAVLQPLYQLTMPRCEVEQSAKPNLTVYSGMAHKAGC